MTAAKAVPGVLDILTHDTVGNQVKTPPGPDGGPTTTTLESDRIWHDGQIIAVVVADSFEAATEAAGKVRVSTVAETPSAGFDTKGVEVKPVPASRGESAEKNDQGARKAASDAAFAAAPVKVDAQYATPPNTLARMPEMESMLMITPSLRARMPGRTACMQL